MKKNNLKRVQLDMSVKTLEFLDNLKEKTLCASRAEVIRNAIISYDLLVDHTFDDNEVILRHSSGNETKLLLPLIKE
jgi:metal-responsive CopG/Arc/MetJ family transcriptional regulator